MGYPYKHPKYNPEGEHFSGDIYSKIILEKEYEVMNSPDLLPKEIDIGLEKNVTQNIYLQFSKYLEEKGQDTPILKELIDIYIGQKLMAIRMNKLFYQYGVLQLKLVQDAETGAIKEFYKKTPILRDFNDLNKNASDTLKQINDIINGLKINISTTSLTLQEVFTASKEIIDVDTSASDNDNENEK